jgi:threonine dehydrogenase-like Zn-dependent dehydrogenase
MLDAVIDVTGSPSVLPHATRLVREFGRVVLLGDTTTPSLQSVGSRTVANSIAILGAHSFNHPRQYSVYDPWDNSEMAGLYFDYLRMGTMTVKDLITHRYPPNDAPALYKRLLVDSSPYLGIIYDWDLLASN